MPCVNKYDVLLIYAYTVKCVGNNVANSKFHNNYFSDGEWNAHSLLQYSYTSKVVTCYWLTLKYTMALPNSIYEDTGHSTIMQFMYYTMSL